MSNNKEDLSDMFEKMPNLLRWILSLPICYLGYILAKFCFKWSYYYLPNGWMPYMDTFFDATAGLIVPIYIFNAIIPKYKFISTLVFSISLGILHVVVGTLVLSNGYYLYNSLGITLMYYILSVISIIYSTVNTYKMEKARKEIQNIQEEA